MTKKQLQSKIAHLESINDHLATEIEFLENMLRTLGFAGGIATFKAAANEIVTKGLSIEELNEI